MNWMSVRSVRELEREEKSYHLDLKLCVGNKIFLFFLYSCPKNVSRREERSKTLNLVQNIFEKISFSFQNGVLHVMPIFISMKIPIIYIKRLKEVRAQRSEPRGRNPRG